MKNLKVLLVVTVFISIFSMSCQKAATAGFNYSQNGVGSVFFNNTSSNASSFNWDFGDGTTSTVTSPNHTYKGFGNYTVSLTADGSGGNGSTTQTINVQ
jgi:PKD repeat protein